MNKTLSLLGILCVLMLILAGLFLYLTNENSNLKRRVSELEQQTQSTSNEEVSFSEITAASETEPAQETSPVQPAASDSIFEKYKDENGEIVPAWVIYDNGNERLDLPVIDKPLSKLVSPDNQIAVDGIKREFRDMSGAPLTRFGIDVSQHQDVIDWEKVAEQDVTFAYVRLGYRGYETGRMVTDNFFLANFTGAKEAGLDTGVYFFSQAITEDEAREEAEFVLTKLNENGFDHDLPIVFDWEQHPSGDDPARTDDIDGDIQTECARAFSEIIRENGYDCMVYMNMRTAFFRYDLEEMDDDIWIADYSDEDRFIYEHKMWQYSQSGVLDGINGFVDLNVMTLD